MVVTLTTLLADFGLYVVYDVELLLEPMHFTHFLPDRLPPAKFADHMDHQLTNPLQNAHCLLKHPHSGKDCSIVSRSEQRMSMI
jgi:hypothetical protein